MTVKVVAPYAAGGSSDGMARLTAQYLSGSLNRQVVVENRTGGNGVIAVGAVARARPDGYTLLWAVSPQIVIQPAITKVPYDPVKDLEPISPVATSSFVLVVNPKLPCRTVGELVEYLRKEPARAQYAEGGFGSMSHLSMVAFARRIGVQMTNVTYRGNAPAIEDVVAGHLMMTFAAVADVQPFVKSGMLVALGGAAKNRASQLPDVPTFEEQGLSDFTSASWQGLMAPAGTPQEIIDRIAKAVADGSNDATFLSKLRAYGGDPFFGAPSEFRSLIARDLVHWKTVIDSSGLAQQQ